MMLHSLEIKNKQYCLKERLIQNLITEFYGKVSKQTDTTTIIDFEDVIIEYVTTQTECIDGKMLSLQFESALHSFKKPSKK